MVKINLERYAKWQLENEGLRIAPFNSKLDKELEKILVDNSGKEIRFLDKDENIIFITNHLKFLKNFDNYFVEFF